MIVQYTSEGPSPVMGPPEATVRSGSSQVRSGLIGSQLPPSSVERNTTLPAASSTHGSWREESTGNVQLKRAGHSAGGLDPSIPGTGEIRRTWPLRWS